MTKIVNSIISKIETEKCLPWNKTWSTVKQAMPMNYFSEREYNGMNKLFLSFLSTDVFFMTFKQAIDNGYKIRKGEHGFDILFITYQPHESKDKKNSDGTPLVYMSPVAKAYTVFGISQMELTPEQEIKLKEKVKRFTPEVLNDGQIIKEAEKVYKSYPAPKPTVKFSDANNAYYNKNKDYINVPPITSYKNKHNYYISLFHELIHSTGADSRLKRELNGYSEMKKDEYSREELIAEIGASFLANYCQLKCDYDNSISYISNWLKKIKSAGVNEIFKATAEADKAFRYILNIEIKTENNS